ncbi:hypothetical protein BGZ63DRAFT_421728 [Mariannaea sp. PMI_226]|nr:hypothetical protein BGZ63DRAFT_421728 [Mariannaea sp. PMI_226]
MPRHKEDYKEQQKRWEEWGKRPRTLQPNPEQPLPASVPSRELSLRAMAAANNPTNKRTRDLIQKRGTSALQGLCTIQRQDLVWYTCIAAIDHGRRCSSTLDIKASLADAIGYRVKRFSRKVYRKLDKLSIKGIGTITLPVRTLTGDIEHREAMVWEGANFPYNIRFHHSLAPQFLQTKDVETPSGSDAVAPPPTKPFGLAAPGPRLSMTSLPGTATTGDDGLASSEDSTEAQGPGAADPQPTTSVSARRGTPPVDLFTAPNTADSIDQQQPSSFEQQSDAFHLTESVDYGPVPAQADSTFQADSTLYWPAFNSTEDVNLGQFTNHFENVDQQLQSYIQAIGCDQQGFGQPSAANFDRFTDQTRAIDSGKKFNQHDSVDYETKRNSFETVLSLDQYARGSTDSSSNPQLFDSGQGSFDPLPQSPMQLGRRRQGSRPIIRANTQRQSVNSAVYVNPDTRDWIMGGSSRPSIFTDDFWPDGTQEGLQQSHPINEELSGRLQDQLGHFDTIDPALASIPHPHF